jgi:hypothetical protein
MTATEIARVLGLLSFAAAGCRKSAPATEIPTPATPREQCLHSEGCCGGHVEGDSSCGADKGAATASATATAWTWTVAPGTFAEVNVELGAGAKMVATFTAAGEVAWNVHSHPDDEPLIHAEGRSKAGTQSFTADAAGTYSFLWMNDGKTAVDLSVELRIDGEGKVHSTHP